MTDRQKRFADEYMRDLDQGRAYMVAYPSVKRLETAQAAASRLLRDVRYQEVQEYIKTRLDEIQSCRIADAEEVLEYLTTVMRGEATAEIVVTEGQGMGISRARTMQKHPDMKERLKAAELLAKYHQLLIPKVQIEAEKGGGVIVLAEAVDGEP